MVGQGELSEERPQAQQQPRTEADGPRVVRSVRRVPEGGNVGHISSFDPLAAIVTREGRAAPAARQDSE